MQLFQDNTFFLCLALLSLPALLLGWLEKPLRLYGFLVSVLFVWLSMGSSPRALIYLGIFLTGELAAAKIYLRVRSKTGRSRKLYYLFLLLSILPLALNKYAHAAGGTLHWFGFLGISYMTFKSAQVIIQIYDGQIREVKSFPYLYMMIFFPVLTSGPIDRSERFREDIERVIPRDEYMELAGNGLWRIMLGLVYKVVIAALFYQVMLRLGNGTTPARTLIYMYSYGFYLFFDFAGYSLMAVGSSYLFGVRTPDNFNKPFLSVDIIDFWDRWHITLSHWFRDFVFSRITMDLMRSRKFKSRLTIAVIAFMLNMGLMGIWHGTEPYYIIYGLYHGVLLSLTEIYHKKSKFHKRNKKKRWYRLTTGFITFQLVMIGFFIFSGRIMIYLPA